MAFLVERASHQERLESYETKKYERMRCQIEFRGGREVHGRTFIWAADEAELTVGTFNLKDWQMNKLEG
jgi:hypothetical protein